MSKDYYKILGVNKSASQEEIKGAFRRLAHEHHPDKSNGSDAKFKEINEAYQVLGNQEKRKQYDQFGTAFSAQGGPASGWDGAGFSGQSQGPFGAGFNWSDFANQQGGYRTSGVDFNMDDLGDIFGDIFGGRGSSARRSRRTQGGADLETSLMIDFEDAVFGTEKLIELNKQVVCDHCSGNGAEPGTKIETCKVCGGSGQVATTQQTFFGAFRTISACRDCQGEGKVASKKCSRCSGRGVINAKEQIKIRVPAGIDDGESIRLANKGQAGERGASSGDLYIRIRVKPSAEFRRQGQDLHTTKEISFSQAALGDKIKVKTLFGEVKLKIPAGTVSGQEFRLKDKGVPSLRGRGKGDQIVKVEIRVPKNLSSQQKKLLEELGRLGI